jgi:hypothetical protein
MPVRNSGHGFRPFQCRAFTIGVVRRLSPGVQAVKSLFRARRARVRPSSACQYNGAPVDL